MEPAETTTVFARIRSSTPSLSRVALSPVAFFSPSKVISLTCIFAFFFFLSFRFLHKIKREANSKPPQTWHF